MDMTTLNQAFTDIFNCSYISKSLVNISNILSE